eukprot:TRINITY_DN9593_c1_g1_i4.p1 TRINITY_DN9593_c1_g1~~TRINITY_DN9593_c1_g1_i4.p1  ORF type:complete len:149 (-),score=5.93 TRINITY_DN9593_c1_g1_i4:248-694(-)
MEWRFFFSFLKNQRFGVLDLNLETSIQWVFLFFFCAHVLLLWVSLEDGVLCINSQVHAFGVVQKVGITSGGYSFGLGYDLTIQYFGGIRLQSYLPLFFKSSKLCFCIYEDFELSTTPHRSLFQIMIEILDVWLLSTLNKRITTRTSSF